MRLSELLDWLGASLTEEAIQSTFIKEKDVDLVREYQRLNDQLFGGKLGIYPMKWNRRKGSGALVRFTRTRIMGKTVLKVQGVEVSSFYAQTMDVLRNRLAHEMIHVFLIEQNTDDGHGANFMREMKRINGLGLGFDVKVRENESTEGVGYKETGKQFFILDHGGQYGVVIAANRIKDYVAAYNKARARYHALPIKYRAFNVYVSDSPEMARYPSIRLTGSKLPSMYMWSPKTKEVLAKASPKGSIYAAPDGEMAYNPNAKHYGPGGWPE